MHTDTGSILDNLVTLSFDLSSFELRVNACQAPDPQTAYQQWCRSSSNFPFRAQTDPQTNRHSRRDRLSQTQVITLPMPQLLPTWVIMKKKLKMI